MDIRRLSTRGLVAAAVIASPGLSAGCSATSASDPGQNNDSFGAGGNAGAAATAGAGGAAGSGAFGPGGAAGTGSGGIFNVGAQGGMGAMPTGLPDGACGQVELKAEKVTETRTEYMTEIREAPQPVALYLMLDKSGSMAIPGLSLVPNWGVAQNAIDTFVNDPSSANIDVAIQYFPLEDPSCTAGVYTTPAVGLGTLPVHAQNILGNLYAQAPFGDGTPIYPALQGAVDFCVAFQNGSPPEKRIPDEKCVPVLITDGAPSGCNEDFNAIASIAAAGASQGVTTFTMGMGLANFGLLDQIADAGGSDCDPNVAGNQACNVSGGAQVFIDALSRIRDTVTEVIETEVEVPVEVTVPLDCNWAMPTSQTMDEVDPTKVNINFTDQATGVLTELGKVDSEAACSGTANGWYYDNPEEPTEIVACPNVCDQIKAADAKIDIIVGCDTKIAVPE